MKYFLFKLRQDLGRLFIYPQVDLKDGWQVDYDKYWHQRRGDNYQAALTSWQKERADYIKQFFKSGDTVVDVGGGDGQILKYIKQSVDIKGICIDFNDLVLEQASQSGLDTVKVDLSKTEELDKIPLADFIMGLEILEHMPNPEEFIMQVKDKAAKGMIFSVPNTGYYSHRWRLLFGRFPLQWVNHPGEHLRFWTATDIKWWISSLGLKLDRLKLYQGLPFLNKIWPTMFGQGIIIKIKKD